MLRSPHDVTTHIICKLKHHAHIGPLLVVVLVLFLFLCNSFNFALRLGFSSGRLASRNGRRIGTVTFSAMFYFQAESNAFNGRCRPSLRKTSDQGTDRHHLSFTLFTFGFGPPFHFIHSAAPASKAGGAVAAVVCVVSQFLSSQLMSCRSSHATFVVPVNSPSPPSRDTQISDPNCELGIRDGGEKGRDKQPCMRFA